jgi:hypothetical protein
MKMFSICGAELSASLLVQSFTVAVNVIRYRQLWLLGSNGSKEDGFVSSITSKF